MSEEEDKANSEKAGWEAIAKMLIPNKSELDIKSFTPKTNIDSYLNTDTNVQIYNDLTENPTWENLFDPLEFFNLFYEQERIVIDNKNKPTALLRHLTDLNLSRKQLYYLLLMLHERVMYYYYSGLKANHKDQEFYISGTFISKEINKLNNEFPTPDELEPANAISKYDLKIVKEHLTTLTAFTDKIIYLTEISTEYKQNKTIDPLFGVSFDKQCELEIQKLKELSKLSQSTVPLKVEKDHLTGFTNGQIVLIFHYFYEYCKLKTIVIDKTTLAKFIHLVTGKDFTTNANSDIYNKLNKAPNFSGDKKLIENLEIIKPLFQKVKLDEIVKMIDNELITAHNEIK